MKRLLSIAVLLILCVITCGCTQQPVTPSIEGKPAGTSATAPVSRTAGVPAAGSALAELSSARPNASLSLDPGVFILSFQTDGPRKMQFRINGFEDYENSVIDTTGPFAGSLTFGPVIKTGVYTLNITGNGSWTAQLTRVDMVSLMKVPVHLSGSGTQVTPFFYLEKGQYIFERNETGLSSPMYFLRYANGSYLMDSNNTYVQPGFGELSQEPFRFISIPESGNYYLNSLTNNNPGNWSASIIPSPTIPPMGPGPVMPEKGK